VKEGIMEQVWVAFVISGLVLFWEGAVTEIYRRLSEKHSKIAVSEQSSKVIAGLALYIWGIFKLETPPLSWAVAGLLLLILIFVIVSSIDPLRRKKRRRT
jgi:hypothetical membrane protein